MRAQATVWLCLALLGGCGDGGSGALESADPLHDTSVRIPAVAVELPSLPRAAASNLFPVERPPPFSAGIFPCSRCHEGGAQAPGDERPSTPHRTHLDRDLECADCHNPEDDQADPALPAVETCFECHEDLEGETPAVRAFFASIRTAEGYAFERRWKTRDTIAHHAGHARAGVGCAQCHGEATDEPFEKPRSVPLMKACIACHAERHQSVECATCHREIRDPQHKNIVLRHAEDQRGCLDCHSEADRDKLRLAGGQRIPFTESYRLCGQCHGPKLRDWKAGLHGKRTGRWDGRKEYLLCVHCHRDPHRPQFPRMAPDPPPMRPEDIK